MASQDMEADQHAESHVARHDLPPAEPEHHGSPEHLEQVGKRGCRVTEFRKFLSPLQFGCLMAAPAGIEVILACGRPQRVDDAQSRHPDPLEKALIATDPMVQVPAQADHCPHRGNAESCEGQHGEGQRNVPGQHEGEEQQARRQFDRQADKLSRSHAGHLVDQLDPRRQVAGVAMGEELHGKPEKPGDEAVRLTSRETNDKLAQ